MQIFCDFAGTISIQDATEWILRHFVDASGELIEQEWKRGTIGLAECMERQIAISRESKRSSAVGVGYFIRRILTHHTLGCLASAFEASYAASKISDLFLGRGRYA